MNEVKESLRNLEQKYKLFQQQQFTFIAALEHCRETAHDKIRPITSIEQVEPPGRWEGRGGTGRGAGRGWGRAGISRTCQTQRCLGSTRPCPLLAR